MRRTRRSDSGIKGVLGFLLFAAAVNIIVTSLHKDKPGVPRFVKETVAGLTAAGGAAKKKARPQPERKRRLKQSLTDVRQKAQVSAKPKVASQPALPPAGKTPLHPEPRIAIVIDDWGYSVHNLELARSLPCPVTIAVLPNLRFSLTVAQALDAGGHEVILHLPMEARGENAPREKNTVLVGMEDEDVRGIVSDGLASVAYARGVSNHTGSRATEDKRTMKVVLKELRRRKLYFLDSFTSLKSVGVSTARSLGVPCIRRDLFLDNTDDPAYIRRQIKKLRAQARVKGVAVGIGHDKRTTLEVLHEVMPQLQQEGIKFVRISELLEN